MRKLTDFVAYTQESEIERVVDAHLKSIQDEPNLYDGEEELRQQAIEHLGYELEKVGEVTDPRVEEVVEAYATADTPEETPDYDDGVEI